MAVATPKGRKKKQKERKCSRNHVMTTGTFSKAGGGFFPLQRFDRAHTAFLVMVSLVDLVKSLI